MGNWRQLAFLLCIAGTVAVLGCAGPSTHQVAGAQQSTTRISNSDSTAANNNASHRNGSAQPAGAFQTASHRIPYATGQKPKMKPDADSVNLSNMPEQLSPILFVRGAAFSESKGKMAEAQQQYEKALQLDPNNITTLVAYARFRDRIGDSDQAVEVYQRARSVQPQNATVWNDLGLCHARRGEIERALGAMQQAVALSHDNVRYRNNLAAVLVQADRTDDAVHELQKVHPPAVANHNVACLLLRLRNQPLAAEYLRRAVSIDPSLARAQTMLVRMGEADRNTPRGQRSSGQKPVVMPPGPGQPQRTNVPVNAQNFRTSPWESAPRDGSYSSYRRPEQEGARERFPSLEPPVRGDMKRMPAF